MTSFEKVYRKYYTDVYKYSLTLCHNPTLAEDITQETFLKAINGISGYKGQCKLRVWLCQIAKNHYFSIYKKKKYSSNDYSVDMNNLETKLINKESAMEIHKVLHSLNEPYKEVFLLRIFGELPFVDIGILFNKSESWARVTYHRAKLKIKEKIK